VPSTLIRTRPGRAVRRALDLLADCEHAYREAPGHLRRQWNQALFERLVVYDDRIADAEVAEPFATLADPELPARLGREVVTRAGASSGGGSNEELLIGETGFEPATARPPAECATRLRHSPWGDREHSDALAKRRLGWRDRAAVAQR
jgi:hypothetical protein